MPAPATEPELTAEPAPAPQDTVETDALAEPEAPGTEPTPTARFAAWVRETIGPELGAAPPAAAAIAAAEGEPGANGTVARDSRFTSWLRGPSAPATDEPAAGEPARDDSPADETASEHKPATLGSRIPAWLRGAPPARADEPEDGAADAAPDEPATDDSPDAERPATTSRIPAWLRGVPPARADAPEDPATAEPLEDDPADDTTAVEEPEPTAEQPPDDDTGEHEPVGDDARADEVRAAALAARPTERFADETDEADADGDRGVNWPKLDAEALAGLRERFRRPPRDEVVHDEAGEPVLARPIRTRTERRVRHGATIAAGRTAGEVWALRVLAALLVIVLLTTFVLLLASIA